MPDPIENIANLIIEEAKANYSDNNLHQSVCHVLILVGIEVEEKMTEIRRAEIAARLRKEVGGD